MISLERNRSGFYHFLLIFKFHYSIGGPESESGECYDELDFISFLIPYIVHIHISTLSHVCVMWGKEKGSKKKSVWGQALPTLPFYT